MSYTVLARRYRSRDFDELVGQESIARTLQNAIAVDRTAHAYLFCGTRGVGKTSLARIFAKALNVTSDLAEAEAIGDAILRGEDLDVIEIDGASNRGIQEAKDLIAGAGLSPARCRYKIYIIDEVHALTRDAFNALLKTMEEPPSHVKFILCTTDPMKVPATIQSRCQRFDFRAIPTALIAEQLERILGQEGIRAEEGVTALVARLGNGSMRDALSLLDRLIAAADDVLTMERAEEVLGLPDHSLIEGVCAAIIEADPKAALTRGAELLSRGSTVDQALELMAEHLRTLMVVAACGADSELIEGTAEMLETATAQAKHFDVPGLVYLIALCDATGRNARGSATARALFDAALVRMCLSEHFADVGALTAGGGNAGHGGAGGSAGKKKGSEPGAPSPDTFGADPIGADPIGADPIGESIVEVKSIAAPVGSPTREAAAPRSSADSAPPPEVAPATVPNDELWSRVLAFAAGSPKDDAKVRQLAFGSFDGNMLHLRVDESFAQAARFLARQTDSLVDLVERATGRRVRITIDTSTAERVAGPAEAAGERTAEIEGARQLPLVKRAMELFDAVVTDVQPEGQAKKEAREDV